MVTYKLRHPMRFKLLNNKAFVEFFEINWFIQNKMILPCQCEKSPFIDLEHGYILTGDLQTIRNNKTSN